MQQPFASMAFNVSAHNTTLSGRPNNITCPDLPNPPVAGMYKTEYFQRDFGGLYLAFFVTLGVAGLAALQLPKRDNKGRLPPLSRAAFRRVAAALFISMNAIWFVPPLVLYLERLSVQLTVASSTFQIGPLVPMACPTPECFASSTKHDMVCGIHRGLQWIVQVIALHGTYGMPDELPFHMCFAAFVMLFSALLVGYEAAEQRHLRRGEDEAATSTGVMGSHYEEREKGDDMV